MEIFIPKGPSPSLSYSHLPILTLYSDPLLEISDIEQLYMVREIILSECETILELSVMPEAINL